MNRTDDRALRNCVVADPSWGEPRSRTITWYDPMQLAAAGLSMSGLELLEAVRDGLVPPPPISQRTPLGGGLLSRSLLREMQTTVAVDPTDPARTLSYGLGLWRVTGVCGANWGHTGAISGYQSQALWNERTSRTVVIASTMSPAPAAAEARLATVTELALCANTHAASTGPERQPARNQGTDPAPALTEED